MTALDLISLLSQATYVLIFLLVAWRSVRSPTAAHLDMTLFFGILAFVVAYSRVAAAIGFTPPDWFIDALIVAIIALPYVLLRLLDDFTHVPVLFKRAAEIGVVAFAVVLFALPGSALPPPVLIALVAYIAGLFLYSGGAFIRAARRAQGVTKRRLQAISLGAILFALEIVASGGSSLLVEPDKTVLAAVGQVLGLISAGAFFLGFAPPQLLRRAWQAPELQYLLTRAASLPRLPSTLDIVRELEKGAAGATGSQARIGLWQEDDRKVRMWTPVTDAPYDIEPGQLLVGRSFEEQRTIFSADPIKDDPQAADIYRSGHIGAVMAAPITAGERRLGVLVLFAERPPIFEVSDREITQLLADQAAVILEDRKTSCRERV